MTKKNKTQTGSPQKTTNIYGVNYFDVQIPIKGETPLLMDAWDEEAVQKLPGWIGDEATLVKPAMTREEKIQRKIYRLPDGSPALPALAFQKCFAAAAASKMMTGVNGKKVRCGLRVIPEPGTDLVRIKVGELKINSTTGRNPTTNKGAFIARPMFIEWSAILNVRCIESLIKTRQVAAQVVHCGGQTVGVGAWRVANGGVYGVFGVTPEE